MATRKITNPPATLPADFNGWDKTPGPPQTLPSDFNGWDDVPHPAGLPAGKSLPGVPAHPAIDMRAPDLSLGEMVGQRLKSNGSGLIKPLLHPIDSIMSYPAWVKPSEGGDLISDIRENPNRKGVANAIGDTLTSAAIGGAMHIAPSIAVPVSEGLKQMGGKLIDNSVGLHLKDTLHGAQPGRAYLEGGGTPALSMKGLANKAAGVKAHAGEQLGDAYEKSTARIPVDQVLDAVAEPAARLRTLQSGPGGTGVSPSLTAYEDGLLPTLAEASNRGGFTPKELFSEIKRPISENTRWNDPTMYDLNKVRQQTVGRVGGLLTDAVPETSDLNKIYQGSGVLAKRAGMRAETGQSPLTAIGRKGIEGIAGGALGYAMHSPLLAAAPILMDSIPAKTGLGYSLFHGGKAIPDIGSALGSVAPLSTTYYRGGPVSPKAKKEGK